MRKVIAMGETVLDILFKNQQPVTAVPGGSSFNSIISIGRTGTPCAFIGYTGDDVIGQQTIDFLLKNGVSTEYFEKRKGEKSALSLAYLNEDGDANYVFYKPTPRVNEQWQMPNPQADDILLYGSYFACCPGMRPQVSKILEKVKENGAIVYYDINFRASHQQEIDSLLPIIRLNMQHSSIVRGSADDFEILFGSRGAREIYKKQICEYCPLFLCTGGAGLITVCTPQGFYEFQAPIIPDVVSTVGAGDNFNAGFIYGLIQNGITREMLAHLSAEQWNSLIDMACRFAGEACRSTNNYISREFAEKL